MLNNTNLFTHSFLFSFIHSLHTKSNQETYFKYMSNSKFSMKSLILFLYCVCPSVKQKQIVNCQQNILNESSTLKAAIHGQAVSKTQLILNGFILPLCFTTTNRFSLSASFHLNNRWFFKLQELNEVTYLPSRTPLYYVASRGPLLILPKQSEINTQ